MDDKKDYTPEETLQIAYSRAAFAAGDLEYRVKCLQQDINKKYQEMSDISVKLQDLQKAKETPAATSTEAVH